MTLSPLSLECFVIEGEAPAPPSRDYIKGFEAGLLQASDTVAAQKSATLSDIHAALADMQFSYTEARVHLLEQIRPLLNQVAEAVLPAVLKECFGQHLSETIFNTIDAAMPQKVSISVATAAVEDIRSQEQGFTVHGDPDLDDGQAVLTQTDTQIMIDTPALLDALQTALQGLDPLQRTQTHG